MINHSFDSFSSFSLRQTVSARNGALLKKVICCEKQAFEDDLWRHSSCSGHLIAPSCLPPASKWGVNPDTFDESRLKTPEFCILLGSQSTLTLTLNSGFYFFECL